MFGSVCVSVTSQLPALQGPILWINLRIRMSFLIVALGGQQINTFDAQEYRFPLEEKRIR